MKSIFVACCSKAYLTVQGHGFQKRQCSTTPHFSVPSTLPRRSSSPSLPFANIHYAPDALFHAVKAKLGRKQHRPTEFYLDSRYIDEVANPFFKRYVGDQQFIRAFNQANPILAKLWRWSSDYGRSLALWAFGLFSLRFCSRLHTCRFRRGCHLGCKTGPLASIKRRVLMMVSR